MRARYPGLSTPNVAISREERDLTHAGYEVTLMYRCRPLTPTLSPQKTGEREPTRARFTYSSPH